MRKVIPLLILLICISIIQGCFVKENYMEPSNVENVLKENKRVFEEFHNFISKDKSKLVRVLDWLNAKNGYFYYIKKGEISINTNKGETYKTNSDNIEILTDLMRKNNFTELIQEESNKDIILFRIVNNEKEYAMHRLIYHKGNLDSEVQKLYEKIEDDFYYWYTVGE